MISIAPASYDAQYKPLWCSSVRGSGQRLGGVRTRPTTGGAISWLFNANRAHSVPARLSSNCRSPSGLCSSVCSKRRVATSRWSRFWLWLLACGSVVSVRALGGFTAGGSIGLPSINRCSMFRICVFVGAPASNASSTALSTACSSCWKCRALRRPYGKLPRRAMRHGPPSGAIIIMAHAALKCTAWLRRSAR
jgi:hypothetical protein